jgi:serine/threonine-protein kinase
MQRRVWIVLGALLGIVGVGVVLDQVVMPALVHSRPALRMPSVVGMPLQEALQVLTAQGFVVHEVRYEANPVVPEGRVIRQVPYAGAQVRKGRRVYLTVSTGQRSVEVPRLVGLSSREAQLQLLGRGLRLGQIGYEYSDSVPAGYVFWQSVPAQEQVPVGTAVDLLVSQGPRPSVTVPSLVSLSLEEAERVVAAVGLQLGEVRFVTDPTFLPNTVVAQFPEAGQLVPPGTVVSVTVVR